MGFDFASHISEKRLKTWARNNKEHDKAKAILAKPKEVSEAEAEIEVVEQIGVEGGGWSRGGQ